MTPAVVEAAGLIRTFGSGHRAKPVLRGVTFTVEHREMVMIHGRSGSGKTTLLNIVGGLDLPDDGRLVVCDRNLAESDEVQRADLRRDAVAFVFQAFGLIPVLSAAENVEVPLRLQNTPVADRRRRVDELLDAVGLRARARHRPGELSGGEQQRVAIARALAAEPRLLIADEPTGQLDAATGRRIMDLLEGLVKDRGLSLLVATHDPSVMARADRSLQLRDGLIVG